MRKIGDLAVNDGKGLHDNEGLCDTLIMDCNNLMKHMASGQYIQFANTIVGMVQKITNLKKGIRADLDSKDEVIAKLNCHIDELLGSLNGTERGENNGND